MIDGEHTGLRNSYCCGPDMNGSHSICPRKSSAQSQEQFEHHRCLLIDRRSQGPGATGLLSLQTLQTNGRGKVTSAVNPHRICRLNLQGTKENIKPTAALRVEKHTQSTENTGIGNCLTIKVGIPANAVAAPAPAPARDLQFRPFPCAFGSGGSCVVCYVSRVGVGLCLVWVI